MPEWPDMDLAIKLHGKKDMLGCSIPKTVEDVATREASLMERKETR